MTEGKGNDAEGHHGLYKTEQCIYDRGIFSVQIFLGLKGTVTVSPFFL